MECVDHRSRAPIRGGTDLGLWASRTTRFRVYIPVSADLGRTSWKAPISGVGGILWVDLGFIPIMFVVRTPSRDAGVTRALFGGAGRFRSDLDCALI